jgi:hypothetical protein
LFESRGVLAGAYRGRGRKGAHSNLERAMRKHWVEVTSEEAERALCTRVETAGLCDVPESEDADCPTCARRYARLVEAGLARRA